MLHSKFWPKYAKLYGLEYTRPDPEKDEYKEIPSKYDTPPRGYVATNSAASEMVARRWSEARSYLDRGLAPLTFNSMCIADLALKMIASLRA